MKTHIRRQQHKIFKHQDIKQKEPPQKYRLGTINNTQLLAGLNRFYMAITSPSPSKYPLKESMLSDNCSCTVAMTRTQSDITVSDWIFIQATYEKQRNMHHARV